MKKGVRKLLSSVTNSQKYRLAESVQTYHRKVELQMLKERKMTIDQNFASLKIELVFWIVENASCCSSHENVDDMIEAFAAKVGSALKAVAELAQQKVTKVAQSVDAALSEH